MKNIIIIGTGGFASELTFFLDEKEYGEDLELKGYLSTDPKGKSNWEKYNFAMPYLGLLNKYSIDSNDYFVVAIGNPKIRLPIIDEIITLGGQLITLIHVDSKVSKQSIIGIGNIIQPYCIISPNVIIGNNNILTSQSIISHDCKIGDNNFFPTVLLCGNTIIGDNNSFGIRSTTIPSVVIGNNNIIMAGMIIDKDVKDYETIFYKYKERVIAVPKVI